MSASRLSKFFSTAFITGASSGVGLTIASMLLDEGLQVWGTSRSLERLSSLRENPAFHPVVLDLGVPSEAEKIFLQASGEAGGAFDLVIQNAGFGFFAPFEIGQASLWQSQLEAMVLGVSRLSHAAYAGMHARGRGTLVHVSSLAVDFPIPFMSGYNVAKAALSALSESLLLETRGSEVRIIDFRLGDHRTSFNDAMQPSSALLASDSRFSRVWQRLEQNLHEAPDAECAVADLRRALVQGKRGVLRSGSFFQARVAPFFASLAPRGLIRAVSAHYFRIN